MTTRKDRRETEAPRPWLVRYRDGRDLRTFDWRHSERQAREVAARLRGEGRDAFVVQAAPIEVQP